MGWVDEITMDCVMKSAHHQSFASLPILLPRVNQSTITRTPTAVTTHGFTAMSNTAFSTEFVTRGLFNDCQLPSSSISVNIWKTEFRLTYYQSFVNSDATGPARELRAAGLGRFWASQSR